MIGLITQINIMNAIEFIHGLVAIKSLSGEEGEAAAYSVSAMQGLGYDEAFVDAAGNAVGIRANVKEGEVSREIVCLGHIDTVPGEIPVRIEDGVLHGRGSVDAKGSFATFVMAGAQAELPEGTRLVVIGATEEESATSKGARYAVNQYAPDWCIIGEPSNWDAVTLGYKGRVLIDYVGRVEMSHTAGEALGAAEMGIAWLNRVMAHVEAYNEDKTKLFDQLLPSIRTIRTESDGLTNSIYIKLGIRLPVNFDVDGYEVKVREWAAGSDHDLTFYGVEQAYQSTRKTDLARTFHRVMLKRGLRPRYKLKTGTSDMNVVAPIWNCPTVAYGPGDSALDHTPHEHLILDDYLKAIEILTAVLSTAP